MDFRRIDKNTVQCRLTEDEMLEYGFQIEDFFTDQEKAREFLEQIVERAGEEIGYEAEGGMVSMQLMRLPDNSLNITFSDRNPDSLQGMLQHIQQMAGMIDEQAAEDILAHLQKEEKALNADKVHTVEDMGATQQQNLPNNRKQSKDYEQHMRELEKIKREKEKSLINSAKVYAFENMQQIEQFAVDYQTEKNISSRLYRDHQSGTYYLLVKKGKLKMTEYQHLCRRLLDYGTLCSSQTYVEQYCKEHYECMIKKHALRLLKEYCS